jgi:hypothetical protein
VPQVPVSGQVTVDGQPVTSGQVSFIPTSTDAPAVGPSGGTIDSSGKYTIHTDGRAGAPLGKYKVTVNPSMVPTGDGKMPQAPFNSIYSSPRTTTLEVEVVANPASGAYDLKLKK